MYREYKNYYSKNNIHVYKIAYCSSLISIAIQWFIVTFMMNPSRLMKGYNLITYHDS